MLSSCGSDGPSAPEDRQFATDQKATIAHTPTPTPSPPAPVNGDVTVAPVASPSTLLKSRGAPQYVFADLRGTLVSVHPSTPDAKPVVIALPTDRTLLSYDAAPGGTKVSVLMGERNPEKGTGVVELGIYDHDGQLITGPSPVLTLPQSSSTPVAGVSQVPSVKISWSAQGDQMLVTSSDGQVVAVTPDGVATPIALTGLTGRLDGGWWSPRGGTILFRVVDSQGRGSIMLATAKDGSATASTIWPRSDELHLRTVQQVAWLPDGSGVVFSQSDYRTGTPAAAILYEMPLEGGNPTIVATAGRGGPSAGIGDFEISPDGKSIAFTILHPSDGGWEFHSLWIRSLKTAIVYELPTGNISDVTEFGWSDAGLVWRESYDDGGLVETLRLSEVDGSAHVLATTGRPASASPAASPEVSTPQVSDGTGG